MFNSIFLNEVSYVMIAIMIGVALVDGVVAALLTSIKLRANRGVFITVSLLPLVVATTFCFLNVLIKDNTTTAITSFAAIMVGMGLVRFRSAPAKAEEMLVILTAIALGVVNGLGYVVYASIIAVVFPLIYVILASINVFGNRKFGKEKLLKITIPESLEYATAFDETFSHYLKEAEKVGVKTTGMGSMFLLSYRIVMKNAQEEKEMIDELRTKNGNLEISVLPYVEDPREL